MTAEPVLTLAGFGVAFRERVVLAEVTFAIPRRGVVALLGPAGGGKSTLLRTLAGLNEAQPDVRRWGTARYCDRPLGRGNRPVIVLQEVRYFVSTVRENMVSTFRDRRSLTRSEQDARIQHLVSAAAFPELLDHLDDDAVSLPAPLRRALATLRVMTLDEPLLLIDEVTAGLEPEWAQRLMGLMRWYAQTHAVLFVTHNQLHARSCADRCVLLGGGRVQESGLTSDFFEHPRNAMTRHFLDTGSVPLPSPDADPETLADDVSPPPPLPPGARATPSSTIGPRGFRWLLPGVLGGLPRPGIVADLKEDLDALKRLGISALVTLEESLTVPPQTLEAQGITPVHFPIVDMEAPSAIGAAELCRRLDALIAQGTAVAIHCRAGHGRTGTILACHLIWGGVTAVDALDRVRSANPKWVTSEVQVRFLEVFSTFTRWQHGHARRTPPPPGHQPRKP